MSAKKYIHSISGLKDVGVTPSQYDVIVFVDMFYCYDYSLIFAHPVDDVLTADGVPISDYAYRSILRDRMGWSAYTAHPTVGDVPDNWQAHVIRQFVVLNPKARYVLSPRPFSTSLNSLKRFSPWVKSEQIRYAGRTFDEIAEAELRQLGVEYLPRAEEQICDTTGATPDRFSLGWRDETRTLLNEHMNCDYGAIVVRDILAALCA